MGSGSAFELYEEAAEGHVEKFSSSEDVLAFRSDILDAWPDLEDSIEPLAFDPDLDEQSDLSRFVLVTLHASQADRIANIRNLARKRRLIGFDPQTGQAI